MREEPWGLASGDLNADAGRDPVVTQPEFGSVTVLFSGCPALCIAELDASGDVGFTDMLTVLDDWGPCPGSGEPCPADIEPPGGDGTLGLADVLRVLNDWGPCQ